MTYFLNKSHQHKHVLIFILALFTSLFIRAQLNHTVSFDVSKLIVTTDSVGADVYTHLHYPGLSSVGEVGSPELLAHYLKFSVPHNATNFVVTVVNETSISEILINPLYPVQESNPMSMLRSKMEFTQPNNVVYNSLQLLKKTATNVIDEGFLEGENHIVTVAVYPVNYVPAKRELKFCTSMTIRLSYTTENIDNSTTINSRLRAISRPTQSQRLEGRNIVKQKVLNPNQVDAFAPSFNSIAPQTVVNIPVYEYCVITSRDLAPHFDRLIGWKQQKGLFAGVVCVEDILALPDFADGDLISNINDDAGKLRAYLHYSYYRDGITKDVLMGGDNTVLPIRYGKGHGLKTAKYNNIPTDLYFSDLNGNWNLNGNEYYGESVGDKVDYNPEIFIGRLLCNQKSDIDNYTEKLIKYELNPGNGDFGYLNRALYSQSDWMQDGNHATILASDLTQIFPTYTIFEENATDLQYPSGRDIINDINVTKYSFVSINGHGNPGGVEVNRSVNINTRSPKGILALEGEQWYHFPEFGNGLNNLTNIDYPFVSYSMSCTLMPYDIYTDDFYGDDLVYNVKCNFGKSFTCGGLYGGPAFLGNTRFGWSGSSLDLERKFIDKIKQGVFSFGIAEAYSKIESYDHWIKLGHNLLGCPEFEMWTSVPTKYSSQAITRTDNSIKVSSRYLKGNKVALTEGFGSMPQVKEAAGMDVIFNDVSPNSVITIYKHNKIPYIAPLYLQNGNQRWSQYFIVSRAFVGNSVDPSLTRTKEDYIINDKVNLTIEATESVVIDSGFIVQSGASVNIKCKGPVTIYGGEILSGGRLCIEAHSVDIENNFNVESGAIFDVININ